MMSIIVHPLLELKIEYSLFNCQGIPETVCENRLNMLNTAANVNRKLELDDKT